MFAHALITGGLGFIGSYIARHLIENKIVGKVICLDHYGRYVDSLREEFVDFRKLRIEGIADHIIVERGEAQIFSVMSEILYKYKPELIFHLAALPLAKLDNLNTQEAKAGTVDSTCNILEFIGQQKSRDCYSPSRFIYASSSMVYGDFQEQIASEEHPLHPKEIYGTMKLAGEIVTAGLCKYFDIPYTIVRPSAVFGPTDMNRRVTQIFVQNAFQGKTIKINGVDERLDFTYVKDVAKGFVLAAISPNGNKETFNITHGKSHTLLEFATSLKRHFPDLKFEITQRDSFRPIRGTLSIDKARRLIGFEPDFSLDAAIDEYVEFFRENII